VVSIELHFAIRRTGSAQLEHFLVSPRHWLTERTDKIKCKGKGTMTTYWCDPKSKSTSGSLISEETSCSDSVCSQRDHGTKAQEYRRERLID
jgi:hypothetical protein